MRHIRISSMLLLVLAMLASACLAEDAAPAKFFKLDFLVKEVEGTRVLNVRSYSVLTSDEKGGSCSIRTGNKVAVSTGSEYTYFDLGVSIDCRAVKEGPGGLTLHVNGDISSVPQESTTPTNLPPTVRQNKWSSTVLVPLKKPTVIYSSDDLTTKRQMQLELTATPIT